jgi:hypothetical protein
VEFTVVADGVFVTNLGTVGRRVRTAVGPRRIELSGPESLLAAFGRD